MGLFSKKDDNSKSEADELLDKFAAKFKEEITAAITPINERVNTLASKWDKMEEEAKNQLSEETRRAEESTLTDDEKKERASRSREQALFELSVQANARVTEAEVIGSIADKYPKLISELREMFSKTPAQTKAQPNYAQLCYNVVDMLVGREARKQGLGYDRNNEKFFISDATGKGDQTNSALDSDEFNYVSPNGKRRETGRETLVKLGIDPKEFEEKYLQ